MNLFKRAVNSIEYRQQVVERGGINCIPFGMPRLEQYVPGIMRKTKYTVTANSGVGKSKLAKRLFVIQPYKYLKQNPDKFRLKGFYFALEESTEKFMMGLISARLYEEYGLVVDINELRSMKKPLGKELLAKVKLCENYFKDFDSIFQVIDGSINPYGIYKIVRSYAEANGKYHYKTIEIDGKPEKVIDYYEPNDPDEYVEVICDHISLLKTEKEHPTQHATMGNYSSNYGLSMRDRFGYTVVDIQQQEAAKEKQEFTFRGNSIEAKLEPSLDGLANNKETQRDQDIILGVFAPNRYAIERHRDYDITLLKDNYRSLKILKNRDSGDSVYVPLYFNGACDYFEELPRVGDPELSKFYNRLK